MENNINNTIDVLDRGRCTGCGVCSNACPVQAIEMSPDIEGFLYPVINRKLCNQCGKCKKVCPHFNQKRNNRTQPECFAVLAEDELRMNSSSGGMFSLLAQIVLQKKGYVCGVEMDSQFRVKHTIIDSENEMERLRGSKYVQSETGNIYNEVKKILERDRYVLFSGTPCQVAGLYSYLGDEHPKLITVDIVCHGVASQMVFDKYMDEAYGEKKVEKFLFRTKKMGYVCTVNEVHKKDGTIVFGDIQNDFYEKAFHQSLMLRPACGECHFAEFPRGGDFTIGDFWGISQFDPSLNDQKGTSLVLVNNEKAQNIMEQIFSKMKRYEPVPLEVATRNNRFTAGIRMHTRRSRFFEMLHHNGFEKSVKYALDNKYDVGVIGLWYGRNYGSVITYYALNYILESLGLSVLMISNPLEPDGEKANTKTHPKKFARKYYHITKKRSMEELKILNNMCDMFLLGSDQLWNYYLSAPYGQMYFLDFVAEERKKIAYGTSFGNSVYPAPENYRLTSKRNLYRFDGVSVREDFSVDMCKELFDIQAVRVIDPVFLCPREKYDELSNEVQIEEKEDYILAYILDPTTEKTEVLRHLSKKYRLKVKVILDENPDVYKSNRKKMGLVENDVIEIPSKPDVREWLYFFKNAQYIITDSFHGTCFAIIFKKKFLSIQNEKRGAERFVELMNIFGLKKQLVQRPMSIIEENRKFELVNYIKVKHIIEKEKKSSLEWLKKVIFASKETKSYTVFSQELKNRK